MSSKLTVVMYHYVRDLKNSRFPDIKALDFSLFVEQILYLRQHYQFVTAEQVVQCLDGIHPLPDKAVLLTFDDAYIDHYTHVFPFLDRLGIQGSFYVPAKAVSENTVLDVNKIHFTLAGEGDKRRLVRTIQHLLDRMRAEHEIESFESLVRKFAKPSRYDNAEVMLIKNLLQHGLSLEIRSKIVDTLFVQTVGMDEASFSRELYMSTEQVKSMQRHGMHIGCHGYNHFWWNKLDRAAVENEVDKSLSYLLEVGVPLELWTACYPYGSYDDQAIEILVDRRCSYALTTEVGVADLARDTRYRLQRFDTNDLPKDRHAQPNSRYFEH
jgi:peptidoglycan/xylan/chitin deacetylase (PgdA/CDA1 family)